MARTKASGRPNPPYRSIYNTGYQSPERATAKHEESELHYFACYCCKRRALDEYTLGQPERLRALVLNGELCQLVHHELTARKRKTADHIVHARDMSTSYSISQSTWEWLNHDAYMKACSTAQAKGFTGTTKEEFIWRAGFVALYPEYAMIAARIDPSGYEEPPSVVSNLKDIYRKHECPYVKLMDTKPVPPIGLFSGDDVKLYSTEFSMADAHEPEYPRDSIEPRSYTSARNTNEPLVGVARASNELTHGILPRGTDEIVDSQVRYRSNDSIMEEDEIAPSVKTEPHHNPLSAVPRNLDTGTESSPDIVVYGALRLALDAVQQHDITTCRVHVRQFILLCKAEWAKQATLADHAEGEAKYRAEDILSTTDAVICIRGLITQYHLHCDHLTAWLISQTPGRKLYQRSRYPLARFREAWFDFQASIPSHPSQSQASKPDAVEQEDRISLSPERAFSE
jgi:hypothetical protein